MFSGGHYYAKERLKEREEEKLVREFLRGRDCAAAANPGGVQPSEASRQPLSDGSTSLTPDEHLLSKQEEHTLNLHFALH